MPPRLPADVYPRFRKEDGLARNRTIDFAGGLDVVKGGQSQGESRRHIPLTVRATAVIKKESALDQETRSRYFYASLSLLSDAGKEYAGGPRNFSGFEEVAALLNRETAVTHEQLQDPYPRYEKGEEVRISLALESEEAVKNLGFDPSTT